MCFGLLCDKCIQEYRGTDTGRISASQPNIPEPPNRLKAGTVWRRKRDECIVLVNSIDYYSGGRGRVHYKTGRGEGYCPLAVWLEKFSPMNGAECVPPKVVQADFSELERRVVEALGLDMPEPAHKTADFHRLRAAEIFDVKPSDVTPAMRRVGKAANLINAYLNKEK